MRIFSGGSLQELRLKILIFKNKNYKQTKNECYIDMKFMGVKNVIDPQKGGTYVMGFYKVHKRN